MKTLRINPTGHDIVLTADIQKSAGEDQAFANVDAKLSDGQETTSGCLNANEANRIGDWFKSLAEKLAKS